MADQLRIGVIFGGRSGEHEVSLMSARSVLSVLDPKKYSVTQIGITHEGVWLTGDNVLEAMEKGNIRNLAQTALLPDPRSGNLYSIHPAAQGERLALIGSLDVIFPVLHGTFGEDGTLQGLLELADVAYVGSGVLGSAVGMDKALFKDVMRANGIPVVDSILVTRGQVQHETEKIIQRAETMAPYPLFVKPANLGSSVGVTKCRGRSDLMEGLFDAARYDRRVLVERGVAEAREIEVSVLGNYDPQASVPGEIIPNSDFYSYSAKYLEDKSIPLIPAPIPAALAEETRTLAVAAYKACDCAGMARVDFLLDQASGKIYLNELNTIPGFTRISMYPKLWDASGLSYPRLVDRLVELALERKAERDQIERSYGRNA